MNKFFDRFKTIPKARFFRPFTIIFLSFATLLGIGSAFVFASSPTTTAQASGYGDYNNNMICQILQNSCYNNNTRVDQGIANGYFRSMDYNSNTLSGYIVATQTRPIGNFYVNFYANENFNDVIGTYSFRDYNSNSNNSSCNNQCTDFRFIVPSQYRDGNRHTMDARVYSYGNNGYTNLQDYTFQYPQDYFTSYQDFNNVNNNSNQNNNSSWDYSYYNSSTNYNTSSSRNNNYSSSTSLPLLDTSKNIRLPYENNNSNYINLNGDSTIAKYAQYHAKCLNTTAGSSTQLNYLRNNGILYKSGNDWYINSQKFNQEIIKCGQD